SFRPFTRDTRMRSFLVLWLLWLSNCSSSSVFLIEEDDETLAFPIQKGSVEDLQKDILNVLGVDYHPSREDGSKIDDASMKYMEELYSAIEKIDEKTGETLFSKDTEKAEVVEAINPTGRMLLEGSLWKVEFTSSSISTEGYLMGASLHFVPSEELKKKLTKVDFLVDIEGQLSLFSEWNPMTGVHDHPINITSLLLTWRNSFISPKIYLNILTEDGLPPSPSDWSIFIVGSFASVPRVFKESPSTRRAKRSMDDSPSRSSPRPNPFKAKGGRRAACRKHGLYVDFKDLNWGDFVVSPLGFQAYFCSGACSFPLSSTMNATNHAIVQTLAHLLDRRKTSESKCAPLNLQPLAVLFKVESDTKIIRLKRYEDMIVHDCGCQ
ncbi:hypothetical protein PENTCL1PPCAC_2388, partial [Pristionchus entomophagus]